MQVRATNTTAPANYNWFDARPFVGNNYYRIKAVENSGASSYSQIVNIKIGDTKTDIAIYPNPVTDHTITIQLNNQPKAMYVVQLFNNLGQQVFSKTITHMGGSSAQTVLLKPGLSKGMYQLRVSNEQIIVNQKLVVD